MVTVEPCQRRPGRSVVPGFSIKAFLGAGSYSSLLSCHNKTARLGADTPEMSFSLFCRLEVQVKEVAVWFLLGPFSLACRP